ncbi:MAG: AAA family ATPase [Planktomarina sp.]
MKGRHIFIYGDRGVGKTSLGQTAAYEFHPSSSKPIFVSCYETCTFENIIGSIVKYAKSKQHNPNLKAKVTINVPFFSAEVEKQINSGRTPQVETINDALELIRYVSTLYESTPVVVIDEFDRLSSNGEKTKFAELIKAISDQEINVKIIFCGIGESMNTLLGSHYSSGRAITPIKLDKLDPESLWKISEQATEGLDLEIDRETVMRIGLLSDGFPYFVHLVCEKMFWAVHEDSEYVKKISVKHFGAGIDKAVEHALTFLKEAYDKATKKYRDDYEEVLWAMVDKPTLNRQATEIYTDSYLPMMDKRVDRETLTNKQFLNRLNALKTQRHGQIIAGTGAGWYEFNENMLRGYVKIRAKEQGVDLGIDHHNANYRHINNI